MENEIDLREIIRVLWRGRYIILGITVLSAILALVCSFLFTRPVYEATATIDPTPYREETGNNLLTKIPPNQVVLEAVQELSENPAELADSISLEPVGETGLLLVQAIHADPELCADLVQRAALALLSWERDNRIEQLTAQKEQLEEALDRLDETIGQLYGDPGDRDLNKYTPYTVDGLKGVFLELDPVYKGLLTEKSNILVAYNNTLVKLEQLSNDPNFKPENLIYPGGSPDPIPSHRELKVVLTGLLGFMFSILVVFTRHYLMATGIINSKSGKSVQRTS